MEMYRETTGLFILPYFLLLNKNQNRQGHVLIYFGIFQKQEKDILIFFFFFCMLIWVETKIYDVRQNKI